MYIKQKLLNDLHFKRMLQERRLALEREMNTAKSGKGLEKTALDGSILDNVQHQLEIATKVL